MLHLKKKVVNVVSNFNMIMTHFTIYLYDHWLSVSIFYCNRVIVRFSKFSCYPLNSFAFSESTSILPSVQHYTTIVKKTWSYYDDFDSLSITIAKSHLLIVPKNCTRSLTTFLLERNKCTFQLCTLCLLFLKCSLTTSLTGL